MRKPLTPNSSHIPHEENLFSSPPPPPPLITPTKRKLNKKRLIIGISAGLALLLGGGGAAMAVSSNADKITEYEKVHEELATMQNDAAEILETAAPLEPESQQKLEQLLVTANARLAKDAPGLMSFSIDDRINELRRSKNSLTDPADVLEQAIKNRGSYESATADGKDLLAEAEELLKKTKDKILDEEPYKELSEAVATLKEALKGDPDETSGTAFADGASAIGSASEGIQEKSAVVSASHDDWVEAEEAAEKLDPANYETLSERDWQLIERDPDAHEGEKYVLYGAVTQADVATGDVTIRVNTGAVQQPRQYNYDVNTMLLAGTSGVFSDVVQGDHVKMLVEVAGSMTYETTIGGSATAITALAYDVDVIGQF